MSAMDHSHLLTRLIITAEQSLQMRSEPGAGDLFKAVETEAAKPVDRERVIGPEITLCAMAAALAQLELATNDRRRAAIFLRVIGVLLPEVRIALALAIEQRKRPTA